MAINDLTLPTYSLGKPMTVQGFLPLTVIVLIGFRHAPIFHHGYEPTASGNNTDTSVSTMFLKE